MVEWLKYLNDFAPIGAFILFGTGIYQYYRTNELSFRKPFWEKLFSFYVEATTATATIATTTDQKEWEEAKKDFLRLYAGPMCLVESNDVADKMIDFRNSLGNLSLNDIDEKTRKSLLSQSVLLSIACRASIRNDWRIPLSTLDIEKQ